MYGCVLKVGTGQIVIHVRFRPRYSYRQQASREFFNDLKVVLFLGKRNTTVLHVMYKIHLSCNILNARSIAHYNIGGSKPPITSALYIPNPSFNVVSYIYVYVII